MTDTRLPPFFLISPLSLLKCVRHRVKPSELIAYSPEVSESSARCKLSLVLYAPREGLEAALLASPSTAQALVEDPPCRRKKNSVSHSYLCTRVLRPVLTRDPAPQPFSPVTSQTLLAGSRTRGVTTSLPRNYALQASDHRRPPCYATNPAKPSLNQHPTWTFVLEQVEVRHPYTDGKMGDLVVRI